MKIHEYQAKEIMKEYGIKVPKEELALSIKEVEEKASLFDGCVIKAQIHSGGRGKAGGVKLADNVEDAVEKAQSILGNYLYTKQSGPKGKLVNKLLISEKINIDAEYYLSVTVDNAKANLVIIASSEGGTEIEELAISNPEKIAKVNIPLTYGLRSFHIDEVASALKLEGDLKKELSEILKALYNIVIDKDASLVEINPLILSDNHLVALDAKMNFDDNALFMHPDIEALADPLEEDPKELEAKKYDLNYIALDGNIACLVNGAGLAMATMDIISKFGGKPANFLDVGGSASEEKVTAAFNILLQDENVSAILVNIFGGIMKCDVIASGIVEAAKKCDVKVPLIVRLEGTNVKQGKEILNNSGLSFIQADDLASAAKKAVEAGGQ